MRSIVCVRQVPEVSELKFDAAKKTRIREELRDEINPFDGRALTNAVELKKRVARRLLS